MTYFEELGGEPALRSVIVQFVDRMLTDPMIGFFFRQTNRRRLEDKEYEHAAKHLGAPIPDNPRSRNARPQSGRPQSEAQRAHRNVGGQFERRIALLDQVLQECGVPEHIQTHWVSHTRSLRARVAAERSGGSVDSPRSSRRQPRPLPLPLQPSELKEP